MTGLITIRVKFENVFEVNFFIKASSVFWSELNASSLILFQGLFRLNRVELGYEWPDDY